MGLGGRRVTASWGERGDGRFVEGDVKAVETARGVFVRGEVIVSVRSLRQFTQA